VNRRRIILALGYLLATLLAQGAHDHGAASSRSEQPAHPAAAEQGPHFCSAFVPSQDSANACAACQFRGHHQASPLASPHPACLVAAIDCVETSPCWWPAPLLRLSTRAPPYHI
jgi:hypothetical protein